MPIYTVIARPLATTATSSVNSATSLGRMRFWKRVLFWAVAVVQATDTGFFDFEKAQLTTATLTNARGSGLDAGNLTNLFGSASSIQSSSGKKVTPGCKAYPGTSEWPSDLVWKAFDSLIGGALIKTVPLAAPCFNNWPTVRDPTKCASVSAHWSDFRLQ